MKNHTQPSVFFLLIFLVLISLVWSCNSADDDDDDNDDADDDDDNDSGGDDDDDANAWTLDPATARDRIMGSWVGQMAGVAWGAPTEFKYHGRIIPADEVPVWKPSMINNAFIQDDLYVEIPFLEVLAVHGPAASWTLHGEAFRDTSFPLWHGNKAGRDNLLAGIPAPDSGHWRNNLHCDDLDWQIEADFIGAVCPGRPNEAIDIAWRIGHVMTYGDGTLGGVFVAAMHASSFFAGSLDEIIDAGIKSLPEGSLYRQVVEDVLDWHDQGLPWEETWQRLEDAWGVTDRCPSYENPLMASYNIDAKMNGAYILIGLLYGNGDLEESMRIAMRCGQDSDCNPSSVGGILGNWLGLAALPEKFRQELDPTRRFIFTNYTLDDAIALSLDLSRWVVYLSGGEVLGDGENETWVIPKSEEIQPPILEQWPASENESPVLSARIASQDGLVVNVEASATDEDGIAGYAWSFGDLGRAAEPTATHAYGAPGTYEVTAWATDGIGNTAWQVLTVTVP